MIKIIFCKCFYGGYDLCGNCGGNGVIISYENNSNLEFDNKLTIEKYTLEDVLERVLLNIKNNRFLHFHNLEKKLNRLFHNIENNSDISIEIKDKIHHFKLNIFELIDLKKNETRNSNLPINYDQLELASILFHEGEFYFIVSNETPLRLSSKINLKLLRQTRSVVINDIIDFLVLNYKDSLFHPYQIHNFQLNKFVKCDSLNPSFIITDTGVTLKNNEFFTKASIYIYDTSEKSCTNYILSFKELYNFFLNFKL